ncbi:MAG: hypothetical protein WC748_03555 [Legionellales bacterium]|jgi:hypothetical protein
MAFEIKLKKLDAASLLEEKKRLERIIDNIFQGNLKSNGEDIQKKCSLEQVAYALHFIIVMKYLGREKHILSKTNNFNVAVKIVDNNEKLFEQALELVYSQLTAIDPNEDFLERLSLLFSKENKNNIGNRIQLFKNKKLEDKNKQAAAANLQLTSSNTSNLDYATNSDNTEDDKSTSNASYEYSPANNALSANNIFAVSDRFVLTEKMRNKLATLAVIKDTLGKYLPFPYSFDDDSNVLTVMAGSSKYKIGIRKLIETNTDCEMTIDDEKFAVKKSQYVIIRALAIILKDFYKDSNDELLNLTFQDFCKDESLETCNKLIHFFKAKEFLEHAKIYIAKNPNAPGINDVFSRLSTFTLFKTFVDGLNNNHHFLNSYLSCEYLSIFIQEIKIENSALRRTALSGYPQYPSVDMKSVNESAEKNIAFKIN